MRCGLRPFATNAVACRLARDCWSFVDLGLRVSAREKPLFRVGCSQSGSHKRGNGPAKSAKEQLFERAQCGAPQAASSRASCSTGSSKEHCPETESTNKSADSRHHIQRVRSGFADARSTWHEQQCKRRPEYPCLPPQEFQLLFWLFVRHTSVRSDAQERNDE